MTPVEAKNFLGRIAQRDRCILFIQWQSGMSAGDVLHKFNFMWHSQVKPQLDDGCERMKIEFDERKRNDRWYFTYISRDGIHELQKWLGLREGMIKTLIDQDVELDEAIIKGEPIFITRWGTPLKSQVFAHHLRRITAGRITSHMFRKLFKSEASVPDHGIDRNIVEFWMGHINGIDAVGGCYDRNPEIREEILEMEYAKLEPYINVYSGVQQEPLTEEEKEWMRFSGQLRESLEKDPEKQEKFLQFLKNL